MVSTMAVARTTTCCALAVSVVTLFAGCARRPREGGAAASETGGREPASGAPRQKPGPAGPGGGRDASAGTPGVFLVNREYKRTESRILIRRVVGPTRARLDFAAFDANMLFHDPKGCSPRPPERKVPLAALHFGVLEASSLCDRIDQTPLTEEEKGSPMSWLPMSEYLVMWNDQLAAGLADAGAAVPAETWNDGDVYADYQEITRAYLHEADGAAEMWVRVEFKPWVGFLSGVDDEDGDGYREIYGRFRAGLVDEAVVERLGGEYWRATLDREAIAKWAFDLATEWYPRFNTELVDARKMKTWPNDKVRADLGEELAALPKAKPTIAMVSQVTSTRFLYLVLYVDP